MANDDTVTIFLNVALFFATLGTFMSLIIAIIVYFNCKDWTLYYDENDDSKKQIHDLNGSVFITTIKIDRCTGDMCNQKYPLWVYEKGDKNIQYQGYIKSTSFQELYVALNNMVDPPRTYNSAYPKK